MRAAILKERSKQAVPILVKHYGLAASAVFKAETGENYHGLAINCAHGSGDPAAVKGRPRCNCTIHPLAGTPMTGEVTGHYEPEWSERTTLETLMDHVSWQERPDSMTDEEWAHTLKVAQVKPFDRAEFEAEIARLWAK